MLCAANTLDSVKRDHRFELHRAVVASERAATELLADWLKKLMCLPVSEVRTVDEASLERKGSSLSEKRGCVRATNALPRNLTCLRIWLLWFSCYSRDNLTRTPKKGF